MLLTLIVVNICEAQTLQIRWRPDRNLNINNLFLIATFDKFLKKNSREEFGKGSDVFKPTLLGMRRVATVFQLKKGLYSIWGEEGRGGVTLKSCLKWCKV